MTPTSQENDVLKSLIKARIRRFGRHYDYDTGYLEATADADAGAVLRLMMTRGLSKRPAGFPPAPYYAAMLRAAAWEDCGPRTRARTRGTSRRWRIGGRAAVGCFWREINTIF